MPAPGIDIPDALLDQHFGFDGEGVLDEQPGGDTDGGTDHADRAGGRPRPDPDATDTPEEEPGPDDEGEDTRGEDDADGDDEGEEGEEGEGRPDTGKTGQPGKGKDRQPPEEDDADGFFDRRRIQQIKDPEARKVAEEAYRSMHGAFTRRMQELSESESQAERYSQEYEDFVADISTEEGATGFLHTMAESRPQVFTESLLIDVALRQPEVFEAVVERVQRITEDPRERRDFERDMRDENREREDAAADLAAKRQRGREQRAQLERVVSERAATHGLRGRDALEMIGRSVYALVSTNARQRRKTTRQDVEAEVDRVSRMLRGEREEGRKEAGAEGRRKAQEAAKRLADKSKRRPAPGGQNITAGERGKRLDPEKLPKRDDERLGGLVDQYFG